MTRLALSVLAAQLFGVGGVLAQEADRGGLHGTVAGLLPSQPGRSVLILMDNGLSTYADAEGHFYLFPVQAGSHQIAAITPGCDVALGQFKMQRGQVLAVQLHLPPPVRLGSPAAPPGRFKRRRSGVAVGVLTSVDIERMRVSSVEEAIRRVAPRMLMTTGADYGRGMRVEGARGSNTVVGSNAPLILVDGVRLDHSLTQSLHSINVEDVDRIEIVRGASGGWAYGQGGANGVIRIHTRGSSSFGPATAPEACGFAFSR